MSSCRYSNSGEFPGTGFSKAGASKSSVHQGKKRPKSTYKHIPHSEKAPHLVARRNARERRRVQAVNSAFLRLRKHVPHENKHKRLSKVKTLKYAIEYIYQLKDMIEDYDSRIEIENKHALMCRHYGRSSDAAPEHTSSRMENSFAKENQWMMANMQPATMENYPCVVPTQEVQTQTNFYEEFY